MKQSAHFQDGLSHTSATRSLTLVTGLATLSLLACGGPRVYTIDKTVVHDESIYNVSNVFAFTSHNEAWLPDDTVINLGGVDKRQFESLLHSNGGTLFVRQTFHFDDREVVYQAQRVTSWKQFRRMRSRYESAGNDLRKFLEDKKKSQFKLE